MLFWLHAVLLRLLPAMLSGTMTSKQPVQQATPMLIGERPYRTWVLWGIMSVLIYVKFLYQSNKTGLPKLLERPEMFIAVGS